jgi:hypothetical protein
MSAGRILLVVFGGLFVLISIGLLIGGATVLAFDSTFKDSQGFYTTSFWPAQSDSPAVITQPADIRIGPGWFDNNRHAITVKVEASNHVSGKPVFIGVARESDMNSYLNGVSYDEVSDVTFRSDVLHYIHRSGTNTIAPPTGQTFWVASASGTGAQTMQWNVTSGSYSIALMNADGSAPLNAEVSLGLKIPAVLHGIGLGVLIGGIILLLGGGVMIFFGIKG